MKLLLDTHLLLWAAEGFDRLLIAQAIVEKATLLTADTRLGDYSAVVHPV